MKIVVFGIGTLGSHFVDILLGSLNAHERKEILLQVIDCDTVKLRNIQTQIYDIHHIGKFKTDSLSIIMYSRYDYFLNTYFGQIRHTKQILDFASDLLVEATDNPEAIALTMRLSIPVLHLKFSIFQNEPTGLVQWQDQFQLPDIQLAQDPCDLPTIRPFAILTAAQGVLALRQYLAQQHQDNYIITTTGIKRII